MSTTVIIPAAGCGERMGSTVSKQFLLLAGKPIIIHTLERFQNSQAIDEIIVVTQQQYFPLIKNAIKEYHITKISHYVEGGLRRQDSVANALSFLSKNTDIVMVHDAVRPFITSCLLEEVIQQTKKSSAVVLAVPVKDTIKGSNGFVVEKTLDRSKIWLVQTPQAFHTRILQDAYCNAQEKSIQATDDSFLVEQLGIFPFIVKGSYDNIKITTPEDLELAEMIIKRFQN